jgi:predicted metal-dependent enzyme (double-stranded beta helix superfamily)
MAFAAATKAPMTGPSGRPGLQELVQHIRSHTHRPAEPRVTALAVAEVLARLKPTAGMLTAEERAGQADDYARLMLHTEPTFSVAAVVWRPGQVTEIHDHLVWCSFIVLEGVETETIFDLDRDRLVEVGRSSRGPGSVSGVAPPDDIHRVHNTGDTVAITLHVYGADLSQGTSVRRTYELPTA